jgi:hypothetical protein
MATSPKHEPEFEALPLRLAYGFLETNGLAGDAAEVKKSPERLGSYTSTLRRAKIVALLRSKGLLKTFIETSWPHGLSPDGKKKIDFYDRIHSRYEESKSKGELAVPLDTNDDEIEAGTEFLQEQQLRDYLAENPFILEPGLSLWPVEDGDAVEFQVDEGGQSRRVDILARDKSGSPVVIELKVSRGHERTVGQALYYRARVKQRFGAKRVRIFIVASIISPQLRAAASEVPDVVLFEYSLEVKVAKVSA